LSISLNRAVIFALLQTRVRSIKATVNSLRSRD